MSDDFFAVAAKDDAIAALRDRLAALERELAEALEALREVSRDAGKYGLEPHVQRAVLVALDEARREP